MMEGNFESFTLVEPDIEIVVRVGKQELAVIGVFQNKSNVWDILVGVDDTERVSQLSTLFEAVYLALPLANFTEVHGAGDTDAGRDARPAANNPFD